MPADVWSLACVIWEMATTKPPFTQYPDRIVAMYNIAHAKNAPEPPESLTEAAKDFVRKCMTIDARGRATVEQLREHPFIATATKTIAPASPGQSSAPPYAQLPQVPSKPPPEDENSDRIIASIAEDDENAITSPTPAERNRSRTSSDGKMRSGGVPSRARSSDKDPPARARERSPPLEERPSSKEKSRKDAGRGKGGRRDFSPSPDPMDSPPMTTPQRRSDYDPSPSLHPETDFLERGGHSTDDSNSLDSPVRDVPIIWGGEHPAHISLSSPSDSEDSEGESRYKASAKGKAVAGHRSTRAAKKAAGAADDNLVNQDGFTRDECAAIGKKFVAAKPKRAGAARSWDRGEERSDSESDPDLSDDPGGRVSSRNGIKAAAASRPAPKPKFSTTGMGDELSSDSEED
ncbi:kinase-like domain-containing protein [Baffinella frigidus]|nr:kinase-like domain-containing protein [Cryptophyta sp. CCMP2293]